MGKVEELFDPEAGFGVKPLASPEIAAEPLKQRNETAEKSSSAVATPLQMDRARPARMKRSGAPKQIWRDPPKELPAQRETFALRPVWARAKATLKPLLHEMARLYTGASARLASARLRHSQ